jgi:hypothetical protein
MTLIYVMLATHTYNQIYVSISIYFQYFIFSETSVHIVDNNNKAIRYFQK